VACANFEGVEEFYKRKEGLIAATYNVDEIEQRVLGGDGDKWIKRSIDADTVFQLDTFHRNRAILCATRDETERKNMLKLLYAKEITQVFHKQSGWLNRIPQTGALPAGAAKRQRISSFGCDGKQYF
jgi:7,8-dihydro-6-hydroxymethylpterin-pyrophosphokinase